MATPNLDSPKLEFDSKVLDLNYTKLEFDSTVPNLNLMALVHEEEKVTQGSFTGARCLDHDIALRRPCISGRTPRVAARAGLSANREGEGERSSSVVVGGQGRNGAREEGE